MAKVISSSQIPIPTIGYFVRNGYISALRPPYRNIVFLAYILGLSHLASAQDDAYILNRQLYKEALSSINFSPDGSFLLAGFSDGSFKIMDPASFQVSLEVSNAHFKAVNAMDMSPKMDLILTAGHNTIRLWDKSGKKLHTWANHATTIWNAEISKDGARAVSSAHNKTFLLWDVDNKLLLEPLRGHEDVCLAISLSPDNRWIASGSKDQTIKIWDLESRKLVSTMNGPAELIYDLEFSPDSRLLAACSQDEMVRIYDVDSTNLLHILKGHQEGVMEVEFSPDGSYLVSASADQSLILWDVDKGEKIHQFFGHEAPIMDLVFHPDGLSFYSISPAGDLIRWELHPEVFVLKYHEEAYLKELSADPDFEPRRKGESKKDFQSRQSRAATAKAKIVEQYYQLYLNEVPR